jgi:hypothetical protein
MNRVTVPFLGPVADDVGPERAWRVAGLEEADRRFKVIDVAGDL